MTFRQDIDLSPFIALQGEHAWAFDKSLLFKKVKVFYSLIPKNACTSIFTALARANGLGAKWFTAKNRIHNLQPKYNAFTNIDEFHEDTFKIIAFRDPLSRFLSAFNNKLVEANHDNSADRIFFERILQKKISEVRFSEIVRIADTHPHWMLAQHFAPQWSFIFYERYDCVLDADSEIPMIDINGTLVHLDRLNRLPVRYGTSDSGDPSIAEIREFYKANGTLPSRDRMKEIFFENISSNGNIERDFQLYRSLL